MAMSFENPVDDQLVKMIRKHFGDSLIAHDRRRFLFNQAPDQAAVKEIENSAKQLATVAPCNEDEIKTMSDGTRYLATPGGWRKI